MGDQQDFVESFKGYWSDPSVDALAELLTEDVILRQPLGATTRGLQAGQRAFERILAAIPDLRAIRRTYRHALEQWHARRRSPDLVR